MAYECKGGQCRCFTLRSQYWRTCQVSSSSASSSSRSSPSSLDSSSSSNSSSSRASSSSSSPASIAFMVFLRRQLGCGGFWRCWWSRRRGRTRLCGVCRPVVAPAFLADPELVRLPGCSWRRVS
ncbi:MAG: hypothetical protein EXQ55_07465 [Acidobacteria bacterium]|nr:hypothetical protein [Acidobacteriota bacterium]